MMVRQAVLLFSLLSASSCFDFEWDSDVIKKYSETKMLRGCLGDNFLRTWEESVLAASEKCHEEQTLAQVPTFNQFLKGEKDLMLELLVPQEQAYLPVNQNPVYRPKVKLSSPLVFMVPQTPSYAANPPTVHTLSRLTPLSQHLLTSSKYPDYQHSNGPTVLQHIFSPLTNVKQQQPVMDFNLYQRPQRVWWKRSLDSSKPEDSANSRNSKDMKRESLDHLLLVKALPQIEMLKQRMASRISNITCVLKHMELIDEEGRPNYKQNVDLLHRMNIPVSLRNNLLEAQEFCKDFSMCVPVERMSNPLVAEMGNSFVFLKCMKKMIVHSCMANDFVQSDMLSNFGFNSYGRSSFANELKKEGRYSPQDTVRELEYLLDSENNIGFGF